MPKTFKEKIIKEKLKDFPDVDAEDINDKDVYIKCCCYGCIDKTINATLSEVEKRLYKPAQRGMEWSEVKQIIKELRK